MIVDLQFFLFGGRRLYKQVISCTNEGFLYFGQISEHQKVNEFCVNLDYTAILGVSNGAEPEFAV